MSLTDDSTDIIAQSSVTTRSVTTLITSRLVGVTLWVYITLHTVWWKTAGHSRSWNKYEYAIIYAVKSLPNVNLSFSGFAEFTIHVNQPFLLVSYADLQRPWTDIQDHKDLQLYVNFYYLVSCFIIAHQHALARTARYRFIISIPPFDIGIVLKRLYVSLNFSHHLVWQLIYFPTLRTYMKF